MFILIIKRTLKHEHTHTLTFTSVRAHTIQIHSLTDMCRYIQIYKY